MLTDKCIVVGRGFVGKEFERQGFRVFDKDDFHISYMKSLTVKQAINFSPLMDYDIVINCIGKSNTRWCEDPKNHSELLWSNYEVPKTLSEYCYRNKKKFVHISTGCLYDDGNDWTEDSLLTAHCAYTASKLFGEKACSVENDLILRPRLLFSDTKDSMNLIMKLAKFEKHITDVNSITSIRLIVDSAIALLEKEQTGIFNVSHTHPVSIRQLARLIHGEWYGRDVNESLFTGEDLIKQEGLHLVNNTMNVDKLSAFIDIPNTLTVVSKCLQELK